MAATQNVVGTDTHDPAAEDSDDSQDSASIHEPGRYRPEFCDEPVEQTSRDPKLVARRNPRKLSSLVGHSH
jgi:hypothetical protein